MRVKNPHQRLSTLWGLIDRQHNQLIASKLAGRRVLDVGCGYGSLVYYLTERGFEAEGIDDDETSVRIAHDLFPNVKVQMKNAERLDDYPNHHFDSIVLKDCLHHLVGEGDVQVAFTNFRRVLVPHGRLVVLDPNPMAILRIARKLISHVDPEATLDCALRVLREHRFLVQGICFYETLGLPLSGGYVGFRFVPNLAPLNLTVAALNRLASASINALRLGRHFCWRYVIHADAPSLGG